MFESYFLLGLENCPCSIKGFLYLQKTEQQSKEGSSLPLEVFYNTDDLIQNGDAFYSQKEEYQQVSISGLHLSY
jgi:hypothetical protein